ncbi:hypothetical protein Y032_0002g1018 [Ancylostoma ceylanicum]|uniref:Uncharacterized protein n=1 Tax=Ancylostoma ceylanicum TaxID=53326 RepID=A0A016VZA0_9BILA|nr:hypothetical protein Y032_0002g1018 [Ancylostoma ceylanicum]
MNCPDRSDFKSLPHVLAANAIELGSAIHPLQHSHPHDANLTLHRLGGRPTLDTTKRDRAYHGLVDLRFGVDSDVPGTQHTCL